MFVIKKTPLIINSYFCTLELRIYNNKTLITMVKKIMENKVEEEEKGEAQQLKKRKGKDVFPFGNYKNYYGYRIGQGLNEDPRFKVLKKEWFEGKDCLDIGCNSGIITIQIAQKFNCRSILGIDIDSSKILPTLLMFVCCNYDLSGNDSYFTIFINSWVSICSACSRECDVVLIYILVGFFDIVSSKQENFVHGRDSPEKYYDAILCLSVTKWIHLNWGDDGLITLFMRIWKLLRPGGIFVLEPQPWVSYEKNRRVSETTATNFQNIKLYPKEFQEILLDKIGFRTVEDIGSGGLSSSKTGFNRPIFLFRK
ncbi:probable RNA methyltransferase At5g51130 [Citrus clementina]|nr:probable RNA methyltransferase At5g51130 [Citrus x clementina]